LPHCGNGRAVFDGQKIHASVAFKSKDYRPRAILVGKTFSLDWADLVGKASSWEVLRAGLGDWECHLEMDLFDYKAGSDAIEKLMDSNLSAADILHILKRLEFMALSGKSKSDIYCSI
jgi:hypothetical protein